ncbi:MAG: hypothetical protein B9S38_13905 [Verrucomicrobiia bacterium Tous-C4TDCM]|jgi:toxin-antitoxin system PIN domain toxin|nr:MAG: hypothetical protein B9S38_13905 [Verrucomicrobiae bacterium Tous-C4TDCM]
MFLYDVNLLFAMFTADHEHHAAARRWRTSLVDKRWATTDLTVSGFVRLSGNPHITSHPKSPLEAWRLLTGNFAGSNHHYLNSTPPASDPLPEILRRCQGYRQVTDAFLIRLAIANHAVLATFDSGLQHLSPEPQAIKVVPLF